MNRFSEHDASEAYFQRRRERDEYEDDQWKASVETEMERAAAIEESNMGDNAPACPQCGATGQHYAICSLRDE